MAIRERNHVHFSLMGRDDISMDILRSVNGITTDCKIIFHGMLYGKYMYGWRRSDFV
jgi:hypothetical protein